jgi:ribosomal protein S18 acetylase RimI-like enzyme
VPSPARPDELDDIVAFVAAQQARPDRHITYVGDEPDGIAAELAGLSPPWATTARVLRERGALAGVVVAEWDEDVGRSWVWGPWVAAEDETAWATTAATLVDAALAQVPSGVERHEMSGEVAHRRLADLAAARGWKASEASHLLVADAAVVASWPDADVAVPAWSGADAIVAAPGPDADVAVAGASAADGAGDRPNDGPAVVPPIRLARDGDAAAIAPLHDAEFPGTYATADQLVTGALDGSRLVLVADGPGGGGPAGIVGYAAGEIHEDGEGFVDFIVVDAAARGTGLGRALVVALTRRLLARAPLDRVALTVHDHRAPARTLYRTLGFRPVASLVAYRSWSAT